jgi:hypothetical protein
MILFFINGPTIDYIICSKIVSFSKNRDSTDEYRLVIDFIGGSSYTKGNMTESEIDVFIEALKKLK